MPRKLKAFTIPEVLATVAIITIMIAMLLPAVREARRSARRAQCASQMRQIGWATESYMTDNRGGLPGPSWYGQIPRYNKNTKNLARWLGPWMGYGKPSSVAQVNTSFLCPDLNSPPGRAPETCVNLMATGNDPNFDTSVEGYFGNMRRVFGYPPYNSGDNSYPQTSPLRRINLPSRGTAVALQDVDSWSHPTTWVPYRGLAPSHGHNGNMAIRNFMYWDWHVEIALTPRRD